MRVRLTADAVADITHIRDTFAGHDAAIAARVLDHLARVLRTLATWPRLGHAGHRPGTREILVPRLPLVVVYRVDLGTIDEVIVLRVFHVRQDRS
jgi:plasmid stabilization system protein ParE